MKTSYALAHSKYEEFRQKVRIISTDALPEYLRRATKLKKLILQL
jgi:hypothetical protein